MARGVNKVILVGNLGADPELRYTATGSAVANLSVATSRKWNDKATDEWKEETEWHRVVTFGRTAEVAGEYLRKGSKAYIEGRLQTRKWQDKQGQDRYTTEVVCEDLQMLDSRGASGSDQGGQRQQYDKPATGSSAASYRDQSTGGAPPADAFDDDIPF